MHELSIAMNIVEIACEEAARLPDARVEEVRLRLGTDSGIVKDALLFSWPLACEGTAIEGAELLIDEPPGLELQVTGIVIVTENDATPR